MKLENDEEVLIYDIREKISIIILFICILLLMLIGLHKFQWYIKLITIIVYVVLVVFFIKLYKSSNERNIDRKMYKDFEIKSVANIVAVGSGIRGIMGGNGAKFYYNFEKKSWSYKESHNKNRYYYIIVSYNDKLKTIRYIKENRAYDVLKLLLDPYPKEKITIPIDIYIHKNKIYADLDSVDLTKVDGYQDAKKTVEDSYKYSI